MKQLDNIFQFSHVVKIYIPGTVNEKETAADLQQVETENALSFMCDLFGGATCGRFSGAWKNDAGEVITEPVNIVYSYFDGELSKVLQLVEYAENLCKRMNQDCIGIEYDGKLGFITAE